jgi:hypothetical protein
MSQAMIEGALSQNISFLGHTDMGGKPDGAQVMVDRGFAYVGNIVSRGVSVIDVRNPRKPQPVTFVPAMEDCWSGSIQAHEDLLLVANMPDPFLSGPDMNWETYYSGNAAEFLGPPGKTLGGLRLYDISTPGKPNQIGELQFEGSGVHRLSYVGGDYAYISAYVRGYSDSIFMVVDVSNPTEPLEVSRWWLPGMWTAGGESPSWPSDDRVALHHPIVADGIAYAAWRDGGLTLLDVRNPANPSLIAHRNWHPPFGGGTHTTLPLTERVPEPKPYVVVLDEAVLDNCADGIKHTWMVDVREPSNPVTVSTAPRPSERDYCKQPGRFGPHNMHENRPGSFQSSDLIFVTYENAGLRVFDIRNPHRPEPAGHYLPPAEFESWLSPGNGPVVHADDIFVDRDGLIYLSDAAGGLYVLQWEGQ